ncbi:tetratricopeptide repeat protein [Paracoccus aestuarii]|uniref:Tetratricopeptide repeat protein n=1 Tax=Paracoccus aestuarii TaxID=453842 RepID=A0A418ZP96_9RHOB|nr:tetratricopeptide repeat protein [Paracoccus aestuarii]WCR00101.1 tetratricopeptide repeat protein [Paracoccus aestuarii]
MGLEPREGRYSEAIEHLRKAISYKEGAPTLHAQLGDLYLSTDELDLAEHHLKHSISLAKQPWPLVRLSYVYAKRGDFTNSVAAVKQAISLSPHRPEYYVRLGEWFIRAGDLEAAANAMEKAIEIKPDAVTAPKRLARIKAMIMQSQS